MEITGDPPSSNLGDPFTFVQVCSLYPQGFNAWPLKVLFVFFSLAFPPTFFFLNIQFSFSLFFQVFVESDCLKFLFPLSLLGALHLAA